MQEGLDDVEKQIELKRWPNVGIRELQAMITNEADRWESWSIGNDHRLLLTVTEYNSFLGCLFAATYLFACNGRPRAIMELPFKKTIQTLKAGASPMSSSFKTATKYGKQVTAFLFLLSLILCYLILSHLIFRL